MWGTKAHSEIEETVCTEVYKEYLSFVKSLPPRVIQFVKFCIVGGTGVIVDMAVLFLLADEKTLALNITLSKVLAAEAAMISNFIWNELWTFRRTDSSLSALGEEGRSEVAPDHSTLNRRDSLFRRFVLFNAICGIGIGFAVLFLHLFHTRLGWNLYLSNLVAILLVTCWNFGSNSILTWRERRVTAACSSEPPASDIDFGKTLKNNEKHKG